MNKIDLNGKKILFLGQVFYDYHTKILNTLKEEGAEEVMELMGRIEEIFQVEEGRDEEEEKENPAEIYDPPANQEQEQNREEKKEEENQKEEVQPVEKNKEEDNDISSEEEEETVELRRVYENFDEKLEPIQSFNTEYQAELARGKVEIPGGYASRKEFSIRDMGRVIMYYLNRLNYEPDCLQVFYRPENDVLPWVKRDGKRNKNWAYLTFRTFLGLVALELTSLILGKQLDICLTMESSGDGRHRFRDFEATSWNSVSETWDI